MTKSKFQRAILSSLGFIGLCLLTACVSMTATAASVACPSEAIRPFEGQWHGQGTLLSAQGGAPQASQTVDEFKIVDCRSFNLTVQYLDNAGQVTRVLVLSGTAEQPGQPDSFTVTGTITEGANVSLLNGTLKSLQTGTLLGSFIGAIGGRTAYLNELMNVSATPAGGTQLVRTVQMFADHRGGAYLGSRIVNDQRPSDQR